MLPLKAIRVALAIGVAVGLVSLNPWGQRSFAVDRPDLVVTSVSDPPAHVVPGQSFTVTAVVKNVGIVGSAATATKFFLVGATVKKNLNGIQDIDPLAPDASQGPTVTIAVFSDTVPGTYVLQACADGDDVVIESDDTNNCTNSAGSVIVDQTPDLVVTTLTAASFSASQGGTLSVTNTVKNIGPVTANPSTTKYFLVASPGPGKKDLQGVQNVPALDPAATFTETETVTVRTDTAPGLYFLQACADSGKVDPEQDENNNCRTTLRRVSITARPDLTVTSVNVAGAPLTVPRGGSLTIDATVANQGLADAGASTMKYVLVINATTGLTKNLKGTQAVPAVPAGGSTDVQQTVQVYGDTAPGTYPVRACVDSLKVVPETLESNNCATTTATVTVQGSAQGNVDLVVTSVTPPPPTAVPGDSFSVTAVVTNQGTDPSVASTTKFFLVGTGVKKNLKGSQPIDALAGGASESPAATIQVYSDTLPGDYTLQACADGNDQNHELDETNNCTDATGPITILEAPDLVVTALQNPPATGGQGGTFTVQNTVKNIGPAATTLDSLTKYYLVSTTSSVRKDLKGLQTVPPLDVGQTFTAQQDVTIQSDTLPDRYNLQACADSGKVVSEADENNNCFTTSGTILVTAEPDLTVTSVTVAGSPTSVPRLGTLTITAVVKNQGLADDTKTSTMKFLLFDVPGGGTKNLKGIASIPPVAAGATTTVQQTVTVYGDTPLGTYQVEACADSGKVVPDLDRKNNCGMTAGTLVITAQ